MKLRRAWEGVFIRLKKAEGTVVTILQTSECSVILGEPLIYYYTMVPKLQVECLVIT
jgi:hypothetical protein